MAKIQMVSILSRLNKIHVKKCSTVLDSKGDGGDVAFDGGGGSLSSLMDRF